MYIQDTIAAVATAPGKGGVGIIRISGNRALDYGRGIFLARSKSHELEPRKMNYGSFIGSTKDIIDYGYLVYFPRPASFTGEDVVEIHCHGGPIIMRSLLRELFAQGCRPAEPGEFSKRAFVNGKLDLVQAEAIMDMIDARSDQALSLALSQYGGRFSTKLNQLSKELLEVLAQLEVVIDYPDMELNTSLAAVLSARLSVASGELQNFLQGFDQARLYREGLITAILGSPNVGKSSLLNFLAGEDRAIVTDIPGTTRDVLEVPVNIRGIPLLLLDTAGIRETGDVVELIGVERAKKAAVQAQLVLLVFDGSRPLEDGEIALLKEADPLKTIIVINKTDLPAELDISQVSFPGTEVQYISVARGQGIDALRDRIEQMFIKGSISSGDAIVSNERHYRAIHKALGELEAAIEGLNSLPADLVAMDLRAAWESLGEVTGKVWTDDLLNCIFGNFCLGK